MTVPNLLPAKLRDWLSPYVYLSNNAISLVGVVLVTSSVVFWMFLLPAMMSGDTENAYTGILLFLLLPAMFFLGLGLIPIGVYWRRRRELQQGTLPAILPPLDFSNVRFRRLATFVAAATFANIVIASQLTYRAVHYMETVTFCGQTCHKVMQPEFAGYQGSPHSRVECVQCHIGPGASWFVKSKLSGVNQVFAVMFNTYPRPIPTPVHNLRPARETCEACHWPQKFGEDRLRIMTKYGDDETNSVTKTVLLMKIGGGRGGPGIHGVHMRPGVVIRYVQGDEKRQTIPWVEYSDGQGRVTQYLAADAKPESVRNLPPRIMDCMDCHNRPTHSFELPERALDRAMAAGEISPSLPFIKKKSVELLRKTYSNQQQAAEAISADLDKFYRESNPAAYESQRGQIVKASLAVTAIYRRNVFPQMNVSWGTYPNNIGHTDFPGCFRCHDEAHISSDGKKVTQDCNACHQLLAMEEPAPKILTDLGLSQ